MTPQRGAIPLELDGKQFTIFFDAAATAVLFERYGIGFAAELYDVEQADGKVLNVRLKSAEALRNFLFIGLQAEAKQRGEPVSFEAAGELVRPWTLAPIFRAVLDALTGALHTPPVPVGNAQAAETPASPAASQTPTPVKTPAKKTKASTLKTRSGLRLQR